MTSKEVIGNIKNYPIGDKKKDLLDLEWFETSKRIMRKKTQAGLEIVMKFLNEGIQLLEGDILYEDEEKVVVVNILPADAIQVTPKTMFEMGTISYEIGNKHLPLFIQGEHVLIPYEKPLERLLKAAGYEVTKTNVKLVNRLKVTVGSHGHDHDHGHGHSHGHDHDHGHSHSHDSLFSKILDISNKE